MPKFSIAPGAAEQKSEFAIKNKTAKIKIKPAFFMIVFIVERDL
jgi:hypothetical protein